jgi:hypothetical protein
MIRVCTLSAGDSMLTELAQPPLTAVYLSVADQCRRAVELLVGMMNGQRPAAAGISSRCISPPAAARSGSSRTMGPRIMPRVERVDHKRGERKEDNSGLVPGPHLAVMACHHGIPVRTEMAAQEWTPRR